MTRMVPAAIPASTNRGETEMFGLIRDAEKSEDWICLHSLALARHRRKDYAEADFVIVGPAGVFCVEVKGGEVRREQGVWIVGWPGSTYSSLEGPFAQAEKTRYPLKRHIHQQLGLTQNDVLVGWGVAFPHVIFEQKGPDWDQDVVYDQRDKELSFIAYIQRLDRYFRARMAETGKSQPRTLSPALVAQIADCLRGDFEVVETVRGLLVDSRRELVALSAAQFRVLDYALNDRNPRIICDGPAGTGKTLIAVEASRRLAKTGKKVLLLCFNSQLGRFLATDAREAGDRVRISTVHHFLGDIIRQAGLGQRLRSLVPTGSELYADGYPSLFESAAEALLEEGHLPQFDAIVLDEAQDVLNTPVMNCLDLVLEGGFHAGRWLIFLDSKLQSDVYGRMNEAVLHHLRHARPAEFSLNENFRNPKNLVGEMCSITGADRPVCRRQLVSNVDYRVFTDHQDEGRKLRALLVELLRGGAMPGSITILSGRAREFALISRHPPDIGKGIHFLDTNDRPCPVDEISAATVSAFKGLENEIIVLTDLPALDPMSDWGRSIFYVGMTRARSKLFAVINEAFLNARSQR